MAVYEYDAAIFREGDAKKLPTFIDGVDAHFSSLSEMYDRKLYSGVSFGGLIGFNMQRRAAGRQPGLYAATGLSLSHSIHDSLALRLLGVRRKYSEQGYQENDLIETWRDIDVLPTNPPSNDKSVCVALGGMDWIINFRKAWSNLEAWERQGVPVNVITKLRLGHTGIINWYKDNIASMLKALPPG